MRRKKSKTVLFWLVLPSMVLVIGFFLYPIIYNFYISLFNIRIGQLTPPRFVGLFNYINMFTDPEFFKVLINSLNFTLISTAFHVLFGMVLALALNQNLKGLKVARTILILPYAIPGVVAGNLWRWIFHADIGIFNDLLLRLGIINQYVSWLGKSDTAMKAVITANVWKGTPFYMVLFYAALKTVPQEIYEAAVVDGVNIIQKFFFITLPQIKPTLVVALILGFMWSFNYFDLIYIMTGGGPALSTETFPMYIYNQAFTFRQLSRAAAVSFLLFLIALGASLLRLRSSSTE